MQAEIVERRVVASLEELLDGATSREPMTKPGDSLSGSQFERVVIDDERYVLKHLHVDDDWIMRATGDVLCMPVRVWASRVLDIVSHIIDDTVVGCATGLGRNGWGSAILMRDVSSAFIPEGSDHVPWDQQRRFLEHMAEMHATYWDFVDDVGTLPMGNRYRVTTPVTAAVERSIRRTVDPVPAAIDDGFARFKRAARRSSDLVMKLVEDPSSLVVALERLPQTFVHSDWKLGNLGSHPDGRTILVDWAWPGRAPACVDLAWYVAVNCDRLPVPKDDAIATYRDALERNGVRTAAWWDEMLSLSLLGAYIFMAWSKVGAELSWWDERAELWARHL